jgi:F-type H+-transporting ATPase subunit b
MKNSKIKTISIIILLTLILVGATTVFGVEEAGEHHGGGVMEWVWKIVNFAILVFILVKFLAKPMREYFRKRTEVIDKSLKEATEAKELAQKALQEVQEKLRLKDQEVEKIISSAKASGEAEKERLIEEGKQMSEKIKEQAKTNIEMELQNAKAALRAEAAELALKIAEKKLKEELTEEKQKKLIEDSIKRFENGN